MGWLTRNRPMDDPRLAETEALLGRFAANGESMSPQQRQRLRVATLAAFEGQLATRANRHPAHRAPRALAVALAIAAMVALAGTVAAAESGPGQPFYGIRLSVESLTLPSGGSARTEALLAQLDRRLDEARQESARGNTGGVADAVRAYLATLDEMSGGIGQGVSQTAVEAGLERHVSALQDILRSAPSAAQPGLEQALQHARRALQHGAGGQGAATQQSHPGPHQSPPGRP
jgi:hypothetical protein